MTERAKRHPLATAFLALLLVAAIGAVGWSLTQSEETKQAEKKLTPFYDTSDLSPAGALGEVLRQEPLDLKLTNGDAHRVIYRSQGGNGAVSFSSGLVFVPKPQYGAQPRQIVAWAHGTLGLGDECAPSRSKDPTRDIPKIEAMLKRGWVVTATDYSGLGTPGTSGYLIGLSEAYDVINSVRAAAQVKDSLAGRSFVVWGHSQGGHAALFASLEVGRYATELELDGTVASAPAAELTSLLDQQYDKAVSWVIGPLISVSWPADQPNLELSQVVSPKGLANYKRLAGECVVRATVEGVVRQKLGQRYFAKNPIKDPGWRVMTKLQSAPILQPYQPLLVVESENDKVVLPNTTALYIRKACRQKSDLRSLWLANASHQAIPKKSGNAVVKWIDNQFSDRTSSSNCGSGSPVKPAGG